MRLSILTSFCLGLAALSAARPASANDELTVYPAKFRSAEELVGVAKPLFFGKATFSTLQNKVVVSAPANTTAAVMKLFAQIDHAPRRYRISTRLIASAQSSATGGALSAKGLTIQAREDQSTGSTDQQIEALEGHEATLYSGSNWLPGGFAAKVRGGGGKFITVELRQREAANPSLSLNSEVSGKLGQWITVGRAAETSSQSKSVLLGRGKSAGNSTKQIQLKVELHQ